MEYVVIPMEYVGISIGMSMEYLENERICWNIDGIYWNINGISWKFDVICWNINEFASIGAERRLVSTWMPSFSKV